LLKVALNTVTLTPQKYTYTGMHVTGDVNTSYIVLGRMDVNEHNGISNITLRYKLE